MVFSVIGTLYGFLIFAIESAEKIRESNVSKF